MAYSYQPAIQGSSSGSGIQFFNSSSTFGDDTTYTKVFVGGLAWETQSHTLRRYFEQFGDIFEAVVIVDKNTGRSKGYGFVTFFDPESARRACIEPNPVIDGRRANCNLASLGRPNPSFPYGRLRPTNPFIGNVQSPRSAYTGNPGYHRPVSYNYQTGVAYPPYGYTPYGPEYVYPQSVYNPYAGQQYMQIYGLPGTVNTGIYPYGQLRQPIHGGQGYSTPQGFAMPTQHIMQFGRPSINGATTPTFSPVQSAPYPSGVAAPNPGQPQIVLRGPSPPITQGSGSDQTAD